MIENFFKNHQTQEILLTSVLLKLKWV